MTEYEKIDGRSNAEQYADDLSAMIWEWDASGEPFGVNEYDTTAEPLTAYDYLEDVLDIEYRVSRSGGETEYRSAEILIAFGGPNAWVDTGKRQLTVSWWSAPVYRDLPKAYCDQIDDALRDVFDC